MRKMRKCSQSTLDFLPKPACIPFTEDLFTMDLTFMATVTLYLSPTLDPKFHGSLIHHWVLDMSE